MNLESGHYIPSIYTHIPAGRLSAPNFHIPSRALGKSTNYNQNQPIVVSTHLPPRHQHHPRRSFIPGRTKINFARVSGLISSFARALRKTGAWLECRGSVYSVVEGRDFRWKNGYANAARVYANTRAAWRVYGLKGRNDVLGGKFSTQKGAIFEKLMSFLEYSFFLLMINSIFLSFKTYYFHYYPVSELFCSFFQFTVS